MCWEVSVIVNLEYSTLAKSPFKNKTKLNVFGQDTDQKVCCYFFDFVVAVILTQGLSLQPKDKIY